MFNGVTSPNFQPLIKTPLHGVQPGINNVLNTLIKIPYTNLNRLVSFGDSIMDSSSFGSNAYRAKYAARFGLTDSNQAVSSVGYFRAISNCNALTLRDQATCVLEQTGINDIGKADILQPRNYKTVNKMITSLYGILIRLFTETDVAAGSSSVTRSGSFTAFAANSFGGVYGSGVLPGNFACFSSTVGDTWTYTFTGDNICVCFNGSDGSAARGIAEVRIDGVFKERIDTTQFWDGISDSVNDNVRGPINRIYWDLSEGNHTIVVKVITGSAVIIDRFVTLGTPRVIGISYAIVMAITNVSHTNNSVNPYRFDACVEYINNERHKVVKEFQKRNYNVFFLKYRNYTPIKTSDGVHPTQEGSDLIFKDLLDMHKFNTQM